MSKVDTTTPDPTWSLTLREIGLAADDVVRHQGSRRTCCTAIQPSGTGHVPRAWEAVESFAVDDPRSGATGLRGLTRDVPGR